MIVRDGHYNLVFTVLMMYQYTKFLKNIIQYYCEYEYKYLYGSLYYVPVRTGTLYYISEKVGGKSYIRI